VSFKQFIFSLPQLSTDAGCSLSARLCRSGQVDGPRSVVRKDSAAPSPTLHPVVAQIQVLVVVAFEAIFLHLNKLKKKSE